MNAPLLIKGHEAYFNFKVALSDHLEHDETIKNIQIA
jgi:hypothetical protein